MDREKVISALDCRANNTDLHCSICEYFRKNADDKIPFCDFRSILNDAIAMLKEQEEQIDTQRNNLMILLNLLNEQEAVEPKHNPLSPTDWFCGKCGMCISRFHDYCPSCGQAVKWE